MVVLHVKKGNESQFLFETTCEANMKLVYHEVTSIFNGRLRITQLCYDFEDLAKHGPVMLEEMQGLAPGQAEELGLLDKWADECEPSGGWTLNADKMGRRNGRQPNEQKVLLKAAEEAKSAISKSQVEANKTLSLPLISELLHQLRGATLVVYPMGLPPHDPCFLSEDMCEVFDTAQLQDKESIAGEESMLWFCSRHLSREGALHKALNSKNEKSKVVIKISGRSSGPPSKEEAISEVERLQLMHHFRQKNDQLQFEPRAAQCVTSETIVKRGTKNCTWASCREGCTREVYNCTQIRVDYRITPLRPRPLDPSADEVTSPLPSDPDDPAELNAWSVGVAGKVAASPAASPAATAEETSAAVEWTADWMERSSPHKLNKRDVTIVPLMNDTSEWFFTGAKLFPNVKGCGYPPMLNCSIFLWRYQVVGTNFTCYYSRVDPMLVMSDLDMKQVYLNLVLATAIPIPSFIISVIYLAFAYFVIYAEEEGADPESLVPGGGVDGGADADEDKENLDADADTELQERKLLPPDGEMDADVLLTNENDEKMSGGGVDDDEQQADRLPDKQPTPVESAPVSGYATPPAINDLAKPQTMMVVRPTSLQPSGPIAAV